MEFNEISNPKTKEETFSFGTSFLDIMKNESQEKTKNFQPFKSIEDIEVKEKAINEIKKGEPLKSFEKFYTDKEVVLTEVKYDPNALQYASKELQNDTDVVFASVESFGPSLQFASPELRNDIFIVSISLKNNGSSKFISEELLNNQDIALNIVQYCPQNSSKEIPTR